MKQNLKEQLDRIKRLMPKLITEDVPTDVAPTTNTAATISNNNPWIKQAEELFAKRIGMESIDIYFEQALTKLGLISRQVGEEEPKILYDSVTKKITKVNWDRLTPIDVENLMRLEPVRNAFEQEFIENNRINLNVLMTDETGKQIIKSANLKFYTLIENYIKERPNIINSNNVKNFLLSSQEIAKEIFTTGWWTDLVNNINKTIGTKQLFRIFHKNLADSEAVKLREYGQKLIEEYSAYLRNDGGMRPIDTAEYEEKIYNYLLKLNTYTNDISKRIWNEFIEKMPKEAQEQFFGKVLPNGTKQNPVFTIQRLKQMVEYFEKLEPQFATEWTGWFQGFGRLCGDLFSLSIRRKGDFVKRLLNMGLAFETRLTRELVGNLEVKGGNVMKTFIKEMSYRCLALYVGYPAVMSAWEVFKLQYAQSTGHSPYLKLGFGQYYIFMTTFYPDNKDDAKDWLNIGQKGAAWDIWVKVFQRNYKQKFKDQHWYNLFWHSPIQEHISAFVNNPKTSEKNDDAILDEAQQAMNAALLKYQEDVRKMLYNDPKYKDIQNKDSVYNAAVQTFKDSLNQGKKDTIQGLKAEDIEIKN